MGEPRSLAELKEANFERAKTDLHLAFTTYPELHYPVLLPPRTVQILMVTDGAGSFSDNWDFGLGELLSVLAVSPGPYVRFAVTKAHRRDGITAAGTPTQADIDNFHFDTTDLSQYDEIWMFAVERAGRPEAVTGHGESITDAELRAISQFMDGGGGVFATGDHEDLGVQMCGRVPRVRSMRKWYWPNPGPNNEPVAPRVDGTQRHDTNQPGHPYPPWSPELLETTFDDQSDDVPQTIRPKLYFAPSPYSSFRYAYPHPLLCGPQGRIHYLPDHPHEGDCYVPADLTAEFTFSGATFTEYPALPDGRRLAPEVIATSANGPGITDDHKGPVAAAHFGAIGAYNGHEVGVGRIVVDATWHHFFNVNLKGDPINPTVAKRSGFYATPEGLERYEEIKAYFRNIAVWLARPERQPDMQFRALWATRWNSTVVMDFRAYERLDDIPLEEFIRMGAVGRRTLARLGPSKCQSLEWSLDTIVAEISESFKSSLQAIRPWSPLPDPLPEFDPITTYYSEALLDASIGAILYTLADRYSPELPDEDRKRLEENADRETIRDGVRMAVRRVVEAARKSQNEIDELVGPEDDLSLE